jgi:hypothetical protein
MNSPAGDGRQEVKTLESSGGGAAADGADQSAWQPPREYCRGFRRDLAEFGFSVIHRVADPRYHAVPESQRMLGAPAFCSNLATAILQSCIWLSRSVGGNRPELRGPVKDVRTRYPALATNLLGYCFGEDRLAVRRLQVPVGKAQNLKTAGIADDPEIQVPFPISGRNFDKARQTSLFFDGSIDAR